MTISNTIARIQTPKLIHVLVAILAVWLLLYAHSAAAHQPSESVLRYDAIPENSRIKSNSTNADAAIWRWDIAVLDLHLLLDLDQDQNQTVTWRELNSRQSDLQALVRQTLAVNYDDRQQNFIVADIMLEQRGDELFAVLLLAPSVANAANESSSSSSFGEINLLQQNQQRQQLTVGTSLLEKLNPQHEILLIHQGQPAFTAVIPTGTSRTFNLSGAEQNTGFWPSFADFFVRGMLHIWEGFDHLLFLLAMLLPAVAIQSSRSENSNTKAAFNELIKVVTAFTVAHSITLTLAALGWLQLPAQPVELLIAASIVVAALLNIVLINRHHRWPLAFLFGLLHGFGFANNLLNNELEGALLVSTLLGFNLGVEAGQLVIVMIVVPMLLLLHRYWQAMYMWGILRAGSLAIAAIAIFWMFERW